MAPSVVRPVSARNKRLREVLTVNVLRKADTCSSVYDSPPNRASILNLETGLTPSMLGPQQGLELISSVSRDELYFC